MTTDLHDLLRLGDAPCPDRRRVEDHDLSDERGQALVLALVHMCKLHYGQHWDDAASHLRAAERHMRAGLNAEKNAANGERILTGRFEQMVLV
jgi:hypothetical protein